MGPKPVPPEQRFWRKVRKTSRCWIWTGKTNGRAGYGMLSLPGKQWVLAHRFSYQLTHGSIPEDRNVLHKCDNPRCVRPDHLFIGDQGVNMLDMQHKGRGKYEAHRGETNGSSKLTWEQVREVRRRAAAGEKPEVLAVAFDTCFSNIGHIISGRSWRE